VGLVPTPRQARYATIRLPNTREIIDRGIILYFQGPNSFTGEDCGEFHVHGSIAIVTALLDCLGSIEGVSAAEAGDFSRRSFENGKVNLVELEGLADLIASKTDNQRKLAQSLSFGTISNLYSGWRSKLIDIRAGIEASLDFSEEEDVSSNIDDALMIEVDQLYHKISSHLQSGNSGEIITNGFRIALMGPPNSGKSSLLNAMAKRDVSIVSEIEGTTRDVIEVHLDLAGYEVILSDTAGIRNSEDIVENMGVERALNVGENADLILWLTSVADAASFPDIPVELEGTKVLQVFSKSDLLDSDLKSNEKIYVSSLSSGSVVELLQLIGNEVKNRLSAGEDMIVVRRRHRELLENAVQYLRQILKEPGMDVELVSENLRLTSDQIGRITGNIDVEDLLDAIFSKFCIGK